MTLVLTEVQAARIADNVAEAEALFARAGRGDDPIGNVKAGLQTIAAIIEQGFPQLPGNSVDSLMIAIGVSGAALAETVEPWLSAEQVVFGLGAAAGIVGLLGMSPEQAQQDQSYGAALDRLDYLRMLASQLQILELRRSISARGSVLLRELAIRRAMNTPRDGLSLH